MEVLRKFYKQHTVLVIGGAISLLLLLSFLILQHKQIEILNLESRWLLVSGTPLLASLIVGGYIKSFKGFGVVLETSLKKAVTNIDLVATVAMDEVHGDEKRIIQYLERLSDRERRKIHRLIFTEGKKNYYAPYALENYLEHLESLKYFEIRSSNGVFISLVPISSLKAQRNRKIRLDDLHQFINALEDSSISKTYPTGIVKEWVFEDTDLIDSLKEMKSKKVRELAVLDQNKKFLGLLKASDLEKRIVDNVITARENA